MINNCEGGNGKRIPLKILMPDIMKVEFNTRVLQEARSLKKNGHEVEIIGFSNQDKVFKKKIQGINCFSYYLNDSRSGLGKLYRLLTAIKMILGINVFILRSKYDVYHAHNFHTLPVAVLSAKLHGGKVVYDSHESWTIHRNKRYHPEHIIAFIAEKIFLPFVDGFITVNEMVQDYYENKYGIKNGIVLYNTHKLMPLKRRTLFHEKLQIDKKKKIILFQGGFWGNTRGTIELIDAAKYLVADAVVVFLGFGSPEMIQIMKQRIRESKLENRVYLVPPKRPDDILRYTMSADIGMNLINRIGPAQDFQSPWKLFEYCMAGLAVISTDLPFHKKVHEKYNIGPLIEQRNDPEEMAKNINKLILDENMLTEYRANSRMAAEKEFNWERQETKLLKFYSAKCGNNRTMV